MDRGYKLITSIVVWLHDLKNGSVMFGSFSMIFGWVFIFLSISCFQINIEIWFDYFKARWTRNIHSESISLNWKRQTQWHVFHQSYHYLSMQSGEIWCKGASLAKKSNIYDAERRSAISEKLEGLSDLVVIHDQVGIR